MNPAYTPYELAHTLRIAKVKYILTQPDLLDGVVKAAEEAKLPRDRILIFNPNGESAPSGYRQWKDLLKHGEQDWVRFDDQEISASTPAARLFSSGTTGWFSASDTFGRKLTAACRTSQSCRSLSLQSSRARHLGLRV